MVLKIRHTLHGSHVHAEFFVGPDEAHLAATGSLILRPDEFAALAQTLRFGVDATARALSKVIIENSTSSTTTERE